MGSASAAATTPTPSGPVPLTGAPAIEGATANTTFESDAFFPQRLATANYFGALGDSGRTSLILTPAQYRSDPGAARSPTPSARTPTWTCGSSTPATESRRTAQPAGARRAPGHQRRDAARKGPGRHLPARVTGDPSAGVQQVWVTWTGSGRRRGHGSWEPVDLTQDPSTRPSGPARCTLPRASPPRPAVPRAGRQRRRRRGPRHRRGRRLPRHDRPARRGAADPRSRHPGARSGARPTASRRWCGPPTVRPWRDNRSCSR